VAKLKIPDRFKVATIPADDIIFFTLYSSGNIRCEVAKISKERTISVINGA